jgi:acetoin utilization deacetylase AcuC-like enzyme
MPVIATQAGASTRFLPSQSEVLLCRPVARDDTIHVVEDIRFRDHRAPMGHPEHSERLSAVSRAIASRSDRVDPLAARRAQPEEILRVHERGHLALIEAGVRAAPAHLDPDTYVSSGSLEVALLAAGGCIDLARAVARGEARCGLAAVRPPGHHAEASRPMGFCLLNNVAIAARALQSQDDVGRILILDWDVHHGNGSQHSFEGDPSVLYFSTHQFPHYPGTGDFREAGRDAGLGATVNVPLPAGCGDVEYLGVMQRLLVPIARGFAPEMILVSCGFDAHRDDPLASMQVSRQGYLAMTRLVRALADDLCQGRIVFVLEGGYAASGLEEGTSAVLEAMLEVPTPSPPAPEAPAGSALRHVVDRVVAVHGRHHAGLGAA